MGVYCLNGLLEKERGIASTVKQAKRMVEERRQEVWDVLEEVIREIISGAFNSISFLRRLFLLITRLYKSFKSLVANLPPSSGTSGRNSGGITLPKLMALELFKPFLYYKLEKERGIASTVKQAKRMVAS